MISPRGWRPPVADVAIGGLLLVFAVWEEYAGDDHGDRDHVSQSIVAALVILPVLWRQRRPLATFLVSGAAFGTKALLFHPMTSTLGEALGLGVVLYTVSARMRLRTTVLLLGCAFFFGYLRSLGAPGYGTAGNIVNELYLLLPWGIGRLVHALEGRATASEHRVAVVEDWAAESSREAVVEERLRIARELHDIVAHSIGVIHLHAGGGKRMLDHDVDQARLAFETIERAAGDALAETRRLLNVLRPEHDELQRQPTLEDVPALADRVRAAGVEVALDLGQVTGLPSGLSLCVYRIVQEASTNAVRHGRASRIAVRLHAEEGTLVLVVTDDGAEATSPSTGGGHGITGMRQRVAMYGGTLEVGPLAQGGFLVRATFPQGVT